MMYFRFPSFCKLLSRSSKDKILWGVDRETPGKQVQEFVYITHVHYTHVHYMYTILVYTTCTLYSCTGKQVQEFVFEFAPEVHREMKHLEKLEQWWMWNLLSWLRRKGIVEFMFGLAIIQNVCILLRFSALKFELIHHV